MVLKFELLKLLVLKKGIGKCFCFVLLEDLVLVLDEIRYERNNDILELSREFDKRLFKVFWISSFMKFSFIKEEKVLEVESKLEMNLIRYVRFIVDGEEGIFVEIGDLRLV